MPPASPSLKPGMEMIYSKRALITLDSRLKDIPRDWLKYVEPRIVRGGFLPCWQDTYVVGQKGYPTITDPVTRSQTTIQRFVARIFWDFPDHMRVHMMCRNRSCVYPHHMYVCEPGMKVPDLPVEPV